MRHIFNLLIVFTFLACSDSDEDFTQVKIRIFNTSTVKFENTTFNNVNFGDLKPNQTSEYKTFEKSYRYGSVSVTIDGKAYGWLPIDFTGEELLKPGNYTYEYSFDTATETITEKLVKD
ncbi:hypothetical protein AAG747_26730 [Rapidithrix thailandica]|uniref:Uncharacterized protein n=1 Tax=Rapidithrix thailandica TaxID=413964 RepID=A0AAW9SI97_9BACT